MKRLKSALLLCLMAGLSLSVLAQKIKKKEGSLDVLKNETSINVEFTYDDLSVGKYKKEQDYIDAKTAEYNKKEPGRGDNWAKSWIADRENRYEPDFIKLFTENSGMSVSDKGKYTLIFHTTSIEPGFNIGITRKNAYIDAEVLIVETANKSNVIAKISVDNSPGRTAFGYDYDTGERISEAYAKAGKSLGKYIK
jgi:hypothetical protein